MPRIFDNIEQHLLPALQETLAVSNRADFCVGYFNLRWLRQLESEIEDCTSDKGYCGPSFVNAQRMPTDSMRR